MVRRMERMGCMETTGRDLCFRPVLSQGVDGPRSPETTHEVGPLTAASESPLPGYTAGHPLSGERHSQHGASRQGLNQSPPGGDQCQCFLKGKNPGQARGDIFPNAVTNHSPGHGFPILIET